jgi:hypothetical protein
VGVSRPGWYPDPGGQPGMFRYWDGAAWSAVLSPTPDSPAPIAGIGVPPRSVGTPAAGSRGGAGGPGAGPGASGGRRWWLAGGAIVLVLVVVVAFIVRAVGNTVAVPGGPSTSGQSARAICPDRDLQTPTENPTRDGRVYGGQLSYPVLPAPWSAPHIETRVPFGRNAWTQEILVDQYVVNGQTNGWVAAVLVAELNAGDGFFSPQEGSQIVVKCIVGAFYGDAAVTRRDLVNQATTIDGRNAWLVESHLTFDIPDLRTKGELAIVAIVETSESTASIYYASIPDTSPQYEEPARQALAGLRVDP